MSPSGEVEDDTLVMQNLGYYQLHAQPGAWRVRLAQGRAAKLYEIVGADGQAVESQPMTVADFRDSVMTLRVAVRAAGGR